MLEMGNDRQLLDYWIHIADSGDRMNRNSMKLSPNGQR